MFVKVNLYKKKVPTSYFIILPSFFQYNMRKYDQNNRLAVESGMSSFRISRPQFRMVAFITTVMEGRVTLPRPSEGPCLLTESIWWSEVLVDTGSLLLRPYVNLS